MEHPLEEIVSARNELPLQWAEDFRSYRVRTTRKLARLRKSHGLAQRPAKKTSAASTDATNGGRSKRVQRPGKTITEEDVLKNTSVVRVLLAQAERAWAEAMRFRSGITAENQNKDHVRSKLAKAVAYANQAAELLEVAAKEGSISDISLLEIYAYAGLIKGYHAYETHRWKNCVDFYSVTRVALLALTSKAESSDIKELYQDIVSTVVDEHLIFSIYQLEKVRPLRVNNIATKAALESNHPAIPLFKKLDPSVLSTDALSASENNRLDTVTWRKHSAQITDGDVASALFETVQADSSLESKIKESSSLSASVGLFDEVLESWQDTQDLVKANIKRSESSLSSLHDKSIQDQYIVATFTSYSLLLRRIQRDTLLLRQLTSGSHTKNKTKQKDGRISRKVFEKSHDLIRIHETILQSTNQLLELNGVHNDFELLESLTVLDTFYKASRTELIAHAQLLAGNYKESLALYHKACTSLAKVADSNLAVTFPAGVLDKSMLQTAVENLQTRVSQLQAVLTSEGLKKSASPAGKPSAVVDSLRTYPSTMTAAEISNNLVDFNKSLEPLFVKPVFFDIAFNFISYGGSPSSAGSASSSETTSETSGGEKKGFLKGLWGR